MAREHRMPRRRRSAAARRLGSMPARRGGLQLDHALPALPIEVRRIDRWHFHPVEQMTPLGAFGLGVLMRHARRETLASAANAAEFAALLLDPHGLHLVTFPPGRVGEFVAQLAQSLTSAAALMALVADLCDRLEMEGMDHGA